MFTAIPATVYLLIQLFPGFMENRQSTKLKFQTTMSQTEHPFVCLRMYSNSCKIQDHCSVRTPQRVTLDSTSKERSSTVQAHIDSGYCHLSPSFYTTAATATNPVRIICVTHALCSSFWFSPFEKSKRGRREEKRVKKQEKREQERRRKYPPYPQPDAHTELNRKRSTPCHNRHQSCRHSTLFSSTDACASGF